MRLDAESSEDRQSVAGDAGQEQHPVKLNFCESIRRNTHWKCFILTLLISGCLTAILWCRLSSNTQQPSTNLGQVYVIQLYQTNPCDDGYVYIPVAFVVMLYLVYLVECWHCHTRLELRGRSDVNTVYEKIQAMREAFPVVWWKSVCYHYVRRTRQVTRYRNGDAFTSTQVYYERVNSHTAGSAYNFLNAGVKDMSRTLVGLENYSAIKIRFTKGFSFACPEAEAEFEQQRIEFFQENESRDDYMETKEGLDLLNANFRDYVITFGNPQRLPWYISHIVFWFSSLMLLSWPLRVIIQYKTAYVHYHVHKLFGINYLNVSCASCQVTRSSTAYSIELEAAIKQNYTLVPSYSEALLMEYTRDANSNIATALTPTSVNGHVVFPQLIGRSSSKPFNLVFWDKENNNDESENATPPSRTSSIANFFNQLRSGLFSTGGASRISKKSKGNRTFFPMSVSASNFQEFAKKVLKPTGKRLRGVCQSRSYNARLPTAPKAPDGSKDSCGKAGNPQMTEKNSSQAQVLPRNVVSAMNNNYLSKSQEQQKDESNDRKVNRCALEQKSNSDSKSTEWPIPADMNANRVASIYTANTASSSVQCRSENLDGGNKVSNFFRHSAIADTAQKCSLPTQIPVKPTNTTSLQQSDMMNNMPHENLMQNTHNVSNTNDGTSLAQSLLTSATPSESPPSYENALSMRPAPAPTPAPTVASPSQDAQISNKRLCQFCHSSPVPVRLLQARQSGAVTENADQLEETDDQNDINILETTI
ncbi:transmembrane protein 151 homolog [Lingula anatina]|uniref:Transmembrane protein 151 homolog n=1 Tax=Lingula anatina TaxID=7574 RepID=A0A1S3J4L5_LINAN|nr:transmembrane protein 151 homolog [Lingula anatina]|eukprot:XP_013405325.1 transmembrane protein 151 homolog [Lingula anatina]